MIVEELIRIQKERHLTDRQMADILGIHRESWSRNKRTGKIAPSVFIRAAKVFPTLRGFDFSSHPYQKPPKRFLGGLWDRLKELVSVRCSL